MVEIQLADAEEAKDWIDKNQLGRRNLTADSFRLLLGRRYNRQKKAVGKPEGSKLGQSEPISTAEKLASEHGVSSATVKRAGKFAEEVERKPELQKAIHEGRLRNIFSVLICNQTHETKRDILHKSSGLNPEFYYMLKYF